MAVFTLPSEEALARWVEAYAIGSLTGFAGIAAGVQNSNFFVTTTLGRYVLTLFWTPAAIPAKPVRLPMAP